MSTGENALNNRVAKLKSTTSLGQAGSLGVLSNARREGSNVTVTFTNIETRKTGGRLSVKLFNVGRIWISHSEIEGYTVRVVKDAEVIVNNHKVQLNAGTIGIVKEYHPFEGRCTIYVGNPTLKRLADIDLSALAKGVKPTGSLQVVVCAPPRIVLKNNISKAAAYRFESGNNIKKHIAGLLLGFYEERARLPAVPTRVLKRYDNAGKIEQLTDVICKAIDRASPDLQKVLSSKSTASEVIGSLHVFHKGNHAAGAYLRVYSDFKPGPFQQYLMIWYVGIANDFENRDKAHNADINNLKKKAQHARVKRAAQRTQVFILAELPVHEGGSEESGITIRTIIEQCFVLLLRTYVPSLCSWTVESSAGMETAVTNKYHLRDQASILTEIARVSFEKTGYMPPESGTTRGMNIASPLTEQDYYQAMVWTKVEREDRWVFFRSPLKYAGKRKNGSRGPVLKIDERGKTHPGCLDIFPMSEPEPEKGDMVYTSWQIMKQGYGDHEAPYFRLPGSGPYDNWEVVNSMAVNITWKSEKTNQWLTCFLQKQYISEFADPTQPGSLMGYIYGTALYSYFMRCLWPNPPPFARSFGIAALLELTYNQFTRTVEISPVTRELVELHGPRFDSSTLTAVKAQAQAIGLDKVDGGWQSEMDTSHLTDSTQWKDGVIPQMDSRKRNSLLAAAKNGKCDFCKLRTKIIGWTAGQQLQDKYACQQAKDKNGRLLNRCVACVLWGHVCSWTKETKLYGKEWSNFTEGRQANPTRRLQDHPQLTTDAVHLLIGAPRNEEACRPRVIADPGFIKHEMDEIADEEEDEEEEQMC